RCAEAPGLRRALAAGVGIGVATAVKYNGILLLVPAYAAGVMASRAPGLRRALADGWTVVVALVAVGSFLVLCPHMLLDYARARDTGTFAAFAVFATRPQAQVPPGAGWLETGAPLIRTRSFGYHLAASLRHRRALA